MFYDSLVGFFYHVIFNGGLCVINMKRQLFRYCFFN